MEQWAIVPLHTSRKASRRLMHRQFRLLGSRKTIQTGKRGKNDGGEKGTRLSLGKEGEENERRNTGASSYFSSREWTLPVVGRARSACVLAVLRAAASLATVITLPSGSKNVAEES